MTFNTKKIDIKFIDDTPFMNLPINVITALENGHPLFAELDDGSFRKIEIVASVYTSDSLDNPLCMIEFSDEKYNEEEMKRIMEEFYNKK